jgi:hypothetical protein
MTYKTYRQNKFLSRTPVNPISSIMLAGVALFIVAVIIEHPIIAICGFMMFFGSIGLKLGLEGDDFQWFL